VNIKTLVNYILKGAKMRKIITPDLVNELIIMYAKTPFVFEVQRIISFVRLT